MPDKIYLDYAAATPLDIEVLELMKPYFSQLFYNPSADYDLAKTIRQAIDQARSKVAYHLGAKSSEIIFVAGGTEANNLAIRGVMDSYPDGEVLISSIEHESVRAPASLYAHQQIAVADDGRLSLADLKVKLNDQTILVSVMYANNEIGTVQPLKDIGRVINEVKKDRFRRGVKRPLYFHSDACQAANYLDLHASRLGVDMMTINGGKIYGPKQSGALFIDQSIELRPLTLGGGQERNLRSGTENVAGIVGLAAAFDKAQINRQTNGVKSVELRDYFIERLLSLKGVQINGSCRFRLPNNINVRFTSQDNEYLLIALDQAGIMASAGSACSASSKESSHVLLALGLSDMQARSSLRFSLGIQTNKKEIDRTLSVLKGLI